MRRCQRGSGHKPGSECEPGCGAETRTAPEMTIIAYFVANGVKSKLCLFNKPKLNGISVALDDAAFCIFDTASN